MTEQIFQEALSMLCLRRSTAFWLAVQDTGLNVHNRLPRPFVLPPNILPSVFGTEQAHADVTDGRFVRWLLEEVPELPVPASNWPAFQRRRRKLEQMVDVKLQCREDLVADEFRAVHLVCFGSLNVPAHDARAAAMTMLANLRGSGELLRAHHAPKVALGDMDVFEVSFASTFCSVVRAAKDAIVWVASLRFTEGFRDAAKPL